MSSPVCLRAQLDDNLEVVSTGRTGTTYRRSRTAGSIRRCSHGHSTAIHLRSLRLPDPADSLERDPQSQVQLPAPRHHPARFAPDFALSFHAGVLAAVDGRSAARGERGIRSAAMSRITTTPGLGRSRSV